MRLRGFQNRPTTSALVRRRRSFAEPSTLLLGSGRAINECSNPSAAAADRGHLKPRSTTLPDVYLLSPIPANTIPLSFHPNIGHAQLLFGCQSLPDWHVANHTPFQVPAPAVRLQLKEEPDGRIHGMLQLLDVYPSNSPCSHPVRSKESKRSGHLLVKSPELKMNVLGENHIVFDAGIRVISARLATTDFAKILVPRIPFRIARSEIERRPISTPSREIEALCFCFR